MSDVEFGGVLDLSSADTKGFEALPSGTYDCELFEWKIAGTKDKPGAKMPPNTPMVKLQFKVIEDPYENRRLFDQFVIPPNDYEDKEARDKMLGMLVRFFVAMGMEESAVKSKKFNMAEALDDLVGEPVRVTCGREVKYGQENIPDEDKEYGNPVKGYKPAGTAAVAGSGLL